MNGLHPPLPCTVLWRSSYALATYSVAIASTYVGNGTYMSHPTTNCLSRSIPGVFAKGVDICEERTKYSRFTVATPSPPDVTAVRTLVLLSVAVVSPTKDFNTRFSTSLR